MRPLFRYYGSKWMAAKRHGPPRRDMVIEPFAGSACYSVYWEAPRAKLYDMSDDVCHAWDWLIHSSADDVMAVPAPIRSTEEWAALPDGPRQVVYWLIGFAEPRIGKSVKKWYLDYVNRGERTGILAGNDRWLFWDERKRDHLVKCKPKIAGWTIERLDYRDIPMEEAHWFVDPPYQGPPGRAYPHSEIDYGHLGQWCRDLPGDVDVCENEGADWLPFEPFYDMPTMRRGERGRTREAVWRRDSGDLFAEG